ncbi:MAG: sortase domain-bontaining protein [Marmoricola sp.]
MTDVLERPARTDGGGRRRASLGRVSFSLAPKPANAPQRPDEALSLLSSATAMIALVCGWFLLQLLFFGGISADRAQALLYDHYRGQLADATAPVGPVVPPGDPVALLRVKSLGLEQVVVEGTASGDLLDGPGHRRDTVLPGQIGTSVVYGRAHTYGGPFARIATLRPGSEIVVQNAQGKVTYVVDDVRRAGDPVPAAPSATQGRLVLATGDASGVLDSLRANQVVYVDATATKAYDAPGGLPTAVPSSETALASDPSAWPVLVLCLALLVGLTWVVSTARQRWSAVLVWTVAAPVAICLAWFTTDVVVRLLPNLL